MKKSVILAVFIINFCSVFAKCGSDSTWTKYSDGEFFSTTRTSVISSFATAQSVENDFINQFNTNFQQLFSWAFKDIGEQKDESKNAFLIEIKSTEFDKMSGISSVITDVVVPKVKTFKDVIIRSKITQNGDNKTHSTVFIDIYYSNMLLKKAYGTFFVEKCSNNEVKLTATISVRFGWFFNIFVTKKVYKNVVEWRLKQILLNIKEEIENRV
jgi:hypothetical protein